VRKFFIIGHNPNSVSAAISFLERGANALQPDICYHPDQDDFFMYDKSKFWERWNPFQKKPRLADYLATLAASLHLKPYNLALMAFDLKGPYLKDGNNQPAYDINRLYQIIRANFCSHLPEIAILTTVATEEGFSFLKPIAGNQRPNEAIGVDQNRDCIEVNDYFKHSGLAYTYASGITAPAAADSKKYLQDIKQAIILRNGGSSFKMVYVWTLTLKSAMESYLDINVDGIILNANRIDELKSLLCGKYAGRYELAKRGYNPFF
jgi:hypothetical protein